MKIIDLLGRPIAFQRCFVELTGSVTGALLLSQAVYWQKRCDSDDGFWWKTQDQWTTETGMSRHELDSAKKSCSEFLVMDRRGIPAKTWYKVDEERLAAALELQEIGNQDCRKAPISEPEIPQSRLPESGKLDSRNPADSAADNRQSTNKETISETTSVSPHVEFIRLWAEAFKTKFGRDYIFSGAKDGVAVKRLLTSSKMKPDELIAIAKRAWEKSGPKFWSCEKADSLTMFSSRINEIQSELSKHGKISSTNNSSGGRTPANRNAGTLNDPNDYAGVETNIPPAS